MLVKCHKHLHPLVRLNTNPMNKNILEQIASTSEIVKEIVKRELLIFRKYQLDVKYIKCPFQWWQNMKQYFL